MSNASAEKSKATHDFILASGETIGVYIRHSDESWINLKDGKKIRASRTTTVNLVTANGVNHSGVSICAPSDQFVKQVGLKRALTLVLGKTPGLTKTDRREIWKKVLPKLSKCDKKNN